MKKLYEKNELTFAIVWIVVYCVLQSLANPLNKAIGVAYAASAAFCVLQTVVLFAFIRKNNLQKRYGIPGPLSLTHISAMFSRGIAVIRMFEPAGVYLTALFTRLISTCTMSPASTRTSSGSSPQSTVM